MLHLASSQMREQDIYCLSFLPSYLQPIRASSRAGWCAQPVLLMPWANLPLEAVKLGVVPPLPCISLHPLISTTNICHVFILLSHPQAEMCTQVLSFV